VRLTTRGWVCLWTLVCVLAIAVNAAFADKQVECRVENLSTCHITTTANNIGGN
jgi:hypothetical protein